MSAAHASLAQQALLHGALPALVFDAPPDTDEPGTFDLRALDVPVGDAEVRNDLRARWREQPRLVVRVDDEPTPRVEALLLELVRREVRLSATEVDRFSDAHTVVVKVSSKAPAPRLAQMFPVRVRATTTASSAKPVSAKAASAKAAGAKPPSAKPAPNKPTPSPGRTDARRR